ncbi:LysR substrate-binding domain-containing protein [uncultured Roseibium sp.]|uniref:LysR substrate-binding domain-containing protein n=1 Tax=uncultured Roseibium sp. TaxID=1936171 RepID=UPI00263634B0|nr:LysR substrate-binding domain-containing protein [uncultured Roseibium sp.]
MLIDWRNLPPLAALRAFDATARHGGFAGAARSLNVTHAAIAQHVRGLEAHLGVSLAVRQGRKVVLTQSGKQLAHALEDGFDMISSGIARLKEAHANRALRVTTTPFLTERVIMPKLSEFWVAHPGAEISMSPTREYVDVVGEGFDLAVRALLPGQTVGLPGSGLNCETIKETTLIGITSPKLLADYGPEPANLPWLWHDVMDVKLEMMRRFGLPIEQLKRVPIGSANLLLEAVRQGLGVTIFNEAIARDEIETGGIVEMPLPQLVKVGYHALTPKGPEHPLVRPFVAWVRTLL